MWLPLQAPCAGGSHRKVKATASRGLSLRRIPQVGWPKGAWELFGSRRHLLGLWDVVVDKQTASSRREVLQMLQVLYPFSHNGLVGGTEVWEQVCVE